MYDCQVRLTMTDTAADDPTVSALLSMVEFFTSQHPVPVCEAVRCLMAVLSLRPAARVEAPVRLQLGLLLCQHAHCAAEAREHLEKAMLVAQRAANLETVRFHAASVLARLLSGQGLQHQAKALLRGKLEATSHHPYWHIRLLLQLADLLASDRDVPGEVATLSRCADYCRDIGASHTYLLCVLAKGSVLLTHHNYTEAGAVLNQASTELESYHGPHISLLRTFYLTIQVTHLLMAGQVKTAKPHLKQLQQCVQSLSSEPDDPMPSSLTAHSFRWLTRSHAYITVYLVSVLHSVQAGFTDKALSYADKAMQFISQEQCSPDDGGGGVLQVLRTHVLEQSVQCLLMQGQTSAAAEKLQEAVNVCHGHPSLVYSHRAVLHTLLGLFAFATSNLDKAISQFQAALQHTNCHELRVLVSLNLAISYMKVGGEKEAELAALMTSLDSEGGNMTCQSLKSALFYVRGLYSFCSGRLHEAKRHLRETLLIANSSDLNKLTSCSLLLLGQIFLALGNTKETMDMVSPALQLSVKMPENRLQVWAASLLADLYRTVGEVDKEQSLRLQSSSVLQQLEQDQKKASESRHSQLVQWTFGDWPVTKPPHPAPPPSTSEVTGVKEKDTHKPPPLDIRDSSLKPHPPTPHTLTHHTPTPHTPTRQNSMTLNGSPVLLKTPEILLKRVESPARATPPKPLLEFQNLASTVKTKPVAGDHPPPPPTDTTVTSTPPPAHNHLPLAPATVQVGSSSHSHTPPALPLQHVAHSQEGQSFNPASNSHHESPQKHVLPPYSAPQQGPHTPPGHLHHHRSVPPYEPSLPPHHYNPHTLTAHQSTPHPPYDQPPAHQRKAHAFSPHVHSPHHLPSYEHSVHALSQYGAQPSSPLALPIHHPPSLQNSPHACPSPANQSAPFLSPPPTTPPSLTPLTAPPPSHSPAVGTPKSPKLYHLSSPSSSSRMPSPQPHHSPQPPPSHPAMLHHSSLGHPAVESAVDQHMIQSQQRLLWQQTMLQAQTQQKMLQQARYLPGMVHVPPSHNPAGLVAPYPSPQGHMPAQYAMRGVQLLPPTPQLTHMAMMQTLGRDPSSHLSELHAQQTQLVAQGVPPYHGAVHLMPGQRDPHSEALFRQYGSMPRR